MASHSRRFPPGTSWALTAAVLLAASCSTEPTAATDDSASHQEVVELAPQALTITENAQVQLLTSDMTFYAPQFKVKPVLNCIDKISDSQFVAHFGYNNTSSTTQKIDLGPLNRFFPAPANRGEPTVFSVGVKNDQVKVPFDGTLLLWGLDGTVAFANKLSPLCKTPPRVCPVSCDDKNPCTADLCDASTGFRCVHRFFADGTSCADGNACNGDEVCRAGSCRPGKAPVCQDGNPCTANICDPRRGCVFVPRTDGTSCPVSGNCGAGGTCKAGACQARTPNCDDHNPCTADSCTGGSTCKHTPLPVGTTCSDGNFCNGAEVCNAQAQCKAKSRPDCDDHNPCTIDSCLVTGGCGHVPGNDGRKCKTSSGSAGKCDTGICQPNVVACPDDGNPCTDEVIDPLTNTCTHPPVVDDTACNDNNLCTQKDVCKSGVCTGTTPVACAGATACLSAGTCNPTTGLCSGGTAKPNGTGCDDNNLCTSGDSCQAGQCQGTPVVCAGDQCHGTGTCDPGTGVCFNPNVDNGTACSDGLKCTGGDVCSDGVCGGAPVVCTAQDSCHQAGTCDEAAGRCSNPVASDGTACSDGNACTQSDSCVAGVCKGANPVTCPGASACVNAGTCDSTSGLCLAGTPKADGTMCDDGKKCTSGDVCTAGVCGGAAVLCTASDACHVAGTCDEGSGACTNPAAPDGQACNDGNACTQADSCASGTCTGGAPVVCPGPSACTEAGVCQPATGQCVAINKPNGTTCDDGARCTTGDVCTNGACGGAPLACPAPADACHTRGVCVESTGQCTTPVAPDGTACSDGNACTQTDRCVAGACAGSNPIKCAAETACQFGGVCNALTGACSGTTPKPSGTHCDDGIKCTGSDACDGTGTCGGTPLACTGGQTCNESSGSCEDLGTCASCEQSHVVTGECDPRIGCASITTGAADVALCQAARDCFLGTGCWAKDPMDCLCGNAVGTDCLSALANGACKAQIVAAVKDSDPTNVATLFYSFDVPLGFATQQFACDHDFCSAAATPPSNACPVAVCPDDGNPCTSEVVINGVCTHPVAADGAACSDGNACTQTDVCQAGVCKGSNPVQCGADTACTTGGTCDPGSGLCVGAGSKPDGTICSDGKTCTSGDVCTAGVCGGTALTCPGGAACDETTGQCPSNACGECKDQSVGVGLCDPQIGCDKITTGAADVALCVALRDCMLSTHCAVNDPFQCFCGADTGTACLTNPVGACKAQVLAATKTTSPTTAGTAFYDFAVPAGFATQEIACAHDFCPDVCPL
jgi:hypothetical protein